MAKRDALRLSQYQFVETSRDGNGRFFIAYTGGASVFIRDVSELRRFLKIPKSIAMRESLESWLAMLEDMDQKKGAVQAPVPHTSVEGSFDPLAHDVDNENTRMIT